MTLKEYLQKNLITTSRFARDHHIHYNTLRDIVDGVKNFPHPSTIKKILDGTDGQVDLRHMIN